MVIPVMDDSFLIPWSQSFRSRDYSQDLDEVGSILVIVVRFAVASVALRDRMTYLAHDPGHPARYSASLLVIPDLLASFPSSPAIFLSLSILSLSVAVLSMYVFVTGQSSRVWRHVDFMSMGDRNASRSSGS